MSVTVFTFYNLFSEQVMEDLKTHVHILNTTEAVLHMLKKILIPRLKFKNNGYWYKGRRFIDSNADIGTMDNHVNRPEIKEALEHGHGEATRKSDTLDKTTYYYAEKLENGQILVWQKK